MATTIIHFGSDECGRIRVLERLGYSVLKCDSIAQLHAALLMPPGADAVTIEESDGNPPHTALSVIRSSTSARLILFEKCGQRHDPIEREFDLVIPGLTPPEDWVRLVDTLIASAVPH